MGIWGDGICRYINVGFWGGENMGSRYMAMWGGTEVVNWKKIHYIFIRAGKYEG